MLTLAERFWSKVQVKDPDECWPWQGATLPRGYGLFRIGGRGTSPRTAMGVALELEYDDPANGRHALHHCDNPPCCNPRHGFWGTNYDNVRDRVAKGRSTHPSVR